MERLRPVLTLRGRLALLYAATLTVSLVVVFAALNAIVANVLVENTASRLELGAGLVDDVSGRGAPRIEIAASEAVGLIGALGTAVAIVDADGDVIASEANGAEPWVVATTLPSTADAALARGETVREIVATPGGRVLVVAAPISLAGQDGGQGGTGQGPPGGSGPPGQVKKGSAFVAADEPYASR